MIRHSLPLRGIRYGFSGEPRAGIRPQRGATLLVALIMLVLLTLVAVSAVNSTTASIQVVGNSQFSGEAEAVAQQGIEWIISSDFTDNLAAAASSVAVDVNNDGTADYTAVVEIPVCTSSLPLTNDKLNPFNPADATCLGSGQQGGNLVVDASGGVQTPIQTMCFNQAWDIQSTVNDSGFTGASRSVHQGVAIRVPAGRPCPPPPP